MKSFQQVLFSWQNFLDLQVLSPTPSLRKHDFAMSCNTMNDDHSVSRKLGDVTSATADPHVIRSNVKMTDSRRRLTHLYNVTS